MDATFLAERLTVSLDYFREDRSDILSKPDYLPAILGMSLPVSYTHLDVYKRQRLDWFYVRDIITDSENSVWIATSNYGDVYKRQVKT